MVVPQLRRRAQRFPLMRVEVEVQPDREDAERDDAAVEVAAHFFSLSRGFLRSASAVCRRFSRGLLRSAVLSPLWSRLGVQWHLTPIAHRAAIKRA